MTFQSIGHSNIGEVAGNTDNNGIRQFLGLQYATIADRFAPPVLVEYEGTSNVDGTKLGGSVLCHRPGPDMEQLLLQHTLEYDRHTQFVSELECLNLNITVPAGFDRETLAEARLPVFVFIHGGGFQGGSSTYPQYDQKRLVKLSMTRGTPIVAVSLNYRLSAPGFLTSEELRNAGYKANNALRDQRAALQWIQSNISGFGGNPSNVTLMGESAGGVSVSYHLMSKEPLFKRAMLMSGTHLLMPPAPLGFAEQNYKKVIAALGLDNATPAERVKALTTGIDGIELCSKLFKAGIPSLPIIDNDIVNFRPTFANVSTGTLDFPGKKWCHSILLGDCQFDGNIMGLRLLHRRKNIAQHFCASISTSIPGEPGQNLLLSYGLTPSTPDDEAFIKVLRVFNDVNFYAPTLAFAESLSESMPVYMYRFNEPNPWDGPDPKFPSYKGEATHIQDLTWLLQNYNEFLKEPQRKQAEMFADGVVAFVNGEVPWKAWRREERVARVVGPEGRVEVREDAALGNGRRNIVHELATEVEGGLDGINEALNAFMRAPPPTVE